MERQLNKAFVIGGTGYVGSYLLEELVHAEVKVECLVHQQRPHLKLEKSAHYHASIIDFNWSVLEDNLPDVIFHAARMSGTDKASRQAAAISNAKANQRLLKWLEKLENPPLLLFVSGSLVYGSHGDQAVDESTAENPISFQREYFLAEKPILEAMRQKKLPIMIVRPGWIYGPASWLESFYLDPARKKKSIPCYGKGNNWMSFVHVRDCAALMVHCARYGDEGNILNLFTGDAIQQNEFVRLLSSMMNFPVKHKPLWWIGLRYDTAVREAFGFSSRMTSVHKGLYDGFKPYYPDLEPALEEIVGKQSQ